MSKSDKQKLKLLYLKEILERDTDENHGLSMSRIIEKLKNEGIEAERRSIYDDLTWLEEYGMDIQRPSGKDREYRLVSRGKNDLELNEIKLLIDSMLASKSISEEQTRKIIEKLEKLCSIYEEKSLQRQVLLANRVKTMNGTVHTNIDYINQAIVEDRQISFKYFKHNMKKEPVLKEKEFIASPFALIYNDDIYYLLAYMRKQPYHFRVDRMMKVRIRTNHKRRGKEEFEKIDLSAYTKYNFGMFSGTQKSVTMRFSDDLVDVVMDRFGPNVFITQEDENHFLVTVNISVSSQFFGWVFGLGDKAEIVEPLPVRKQYLNTLAQNRKIYSR